MGGILFMQDISKMDDNLSVDEIRKLIDEFIKCYMNVADRNSLLFAFEQLCELADRQSNTYTILDKNHQNKITDFIQNHVSDFDDYDGEDEMEKKEVTVKNLATQDQTLVKFDDLETVLHSLLNEYISKLAKLEDEEE